MTILAISQQQIKNVGKLQKIFMNHGRVIACWFLHFQFFFFQKTACKLCKMSNIKNMCCVWSKGFSLNTQCVHYRVTNSTKMSIRAKILMLKLNNGSILSPAQSQFEISFNRFTMTMVVLSYNRKLGLFITTF